VGAMTPMDPERYHAKNHFDFIPFAECRKCQRAQAVCRGKRSYPSWQEADTAIVEINEADGYTRHLTRHRCRWCLVWHLATAKTKPQLHRSEKRRRKWLRKEAA
jgi:hypothetical protein